MATPRRLDAVTEMAGVLKSRYPKVKLDPLGKKFAKGHRTATMLAGPRPLRRYPKRPMR